MSRYTKAQIAEAKEILSFVINGEASKPKANKVAKFAGQRSKLPHELFVDLEEHYEDYEGSELAEASRKKFGKANLRCIMLTWAILHKQPSVKEFVGNKKSKELRSWYKRQVA
jgi:hypothetical protein